MSVNYNPKIVTDGLILYYDINNSLSYSSGNTSIYDLRRIPPHTGNFNSLPTFSTSPSRTVLGLGNYINLGVTELASLSLITIEMVLKLTNTGIMLFGFNQYDVYTGGGHLGFNTAAGDVYGLSSTYVTDNLLNKFAHYTFLVSATGNIPSTNKIYINGIQQALAQQLGTTTTGIGFNSGTMRIGGWRYDNNYTGGFELCLFKIYSRELTANEVLINYDVSKDKCFLPIMAGGVPISPT